MKSRSVVVGALLLLVLGLAALLAWQVQIAATYHRHTAEGVLKDYAALAASRVAGVANQAIYGRVAQPTITAAEGATGTPADAIRVRYHFRFDPHSRHLRTSHGAPTGAARVWLVDTLTVEAGKYDAMWYFALVSGGPASEPPGVVVYRRARNGRLAGGVVDLAALTPVLAEALHEYPLLPRSLTHGVVVDSAGAIRIGDAAGRELFASEPLTSPFVGREAIGPWLGGLWAEVTLRPEIANRVITGGVPRSRTPIVIGVFAVAAALTVAALLLVRREAELARLRTDLVAGVSHELRTPLAQIRMFSETLMLARVRSEEERQRSLEIIDQEARRLTHLVDNLLHFSRSERQIERVALRPIDLAEVVRQATEAFAPLAQARGVTLRGDAADALPATADPEAVRQIVLNLLDNAVKYGPPGQTVTVALGASGGQARLTVDDQGPGIPAGDRERVWGRFFRLPRDRGSPTPGTGIGLAVVRELATLHGGRAWVEDASNGGSGARFVVEWPL